MEITATMVKDLREKTGVGMMECKKALSESGGDMERAIAWMREHGLATAAKKAGREVKDGVVYGYVSPDGKTGAMVEVACETDFVARTDDFQSMCRELARLVADNDPDEVNAQDIPDAKRPLLAMQASDGRTANEWLTGAITKLGENMQVRRFSRVQLEGTGSVVNYIHSNSKLGVLVELTSDKPDALSREEFRIVGKDVAMHIAAQNPRYVTSKEIPADEVDRERAIYRQKAVNDGKPEKILENIVAGQVNKWFSEVCLLDQAFVKDDKLKVKEMLAKQGQGIGANLDVRHFVRFQLGEAVA